MKSLQVYICEKLGKFKEQDSFILSIANNIATILDENPYPITKDFTFDEQTLIDNDFKFLFFKNLKIIHANENKYNTYYTKYNDKERIFDIICININLKTNNTYNKLAKTLTHELTHAYDDFTRHINNEEILKDYYNRESKENTFNYNKTLKSDNKKYRMLLNNLSEPEKYAYLNELDIELESSNFDIFNYNTFDDAYKGALDIIFKNENSPYKIYLDGLDLMNELAKNNKEIFINVYNDVNNSNLDFDEIYDKLDDELYDILNEIEDKIKELFNKYYNEKMNKK